MTKIPCKYLGHLDTPEKLYIFMEQFDETNNTPDMKWVDQFRCDSLKDDQSWNLLERVIYSGQCDVMSFAMCLAFLRSNQHFSFNEIVFTHFHVRR